jgi:hypothetical protein
MVMSTGRQLGLSPLGEYHGPFVGPVRLIVVKHLEQTKVWVSTSARSVLGTTRVSRIGIGVSARERRAKIRRVRAA